MVGCRDEAKGDRAGQGRPLDTHERPRVGLETLPIPRDEIRKLASKIRIKETEQKRRRRSPSITVLFGQLLRCEILKYEPNGGRRAIGSTKTFVSRRPAGIVREPRSDVNQLSRFRRRCKMADVTWLKPHQRGRPSCTTATTAGPPPPSLPLPTPLIFM